MVGETVGETRNDLIAPPVVRLADSANGNRVELLQLRRQECGGCNRRRRNLGLHVEASRTSSNTLLLFLDGRVTSMLMRWLEQPAENVVLLRGAEPSGRASATETDSTA